MLRVHHLNKSFGSHQVLDQVSLSLDKNQTVALIGSNGAGKSTLLKIILKQLSPDSGQIDTQPSKIGYIPQQPSLAQTIQQNFDPHLADWQIKAALSQAGLTGLSLSQPTSQLSGGQQTRLAIANLIATKPQIEYLLLDEPTNNLDQSGLDWLKSFITHFNGGVLLVSHDRAFINQVCQQVLELEDGQLHSYGGNYDHYKSQKDQLLQTQLQQYQQNIEQRQRLRKLKQLKTSQIQQTGQQSFNKLKHESRGGFNYSQNASQRSAGQQIRAIDSKLDQLANLSKPHQAKDYQLHLHGSATPNKIILELKDLSFSYGQQPILQNITLTIIGQQRWLISGKNGRGKSTLLKIAAGLLPDSTQSRKPGQQVSIGYFDQQTSGLDLHKSGIDNLQQNQAKPQDIFRQAIALGFDQDSLQLPTHQLSRGQQAKLSIAKLLLGHHHLLILDEPTNYLDLPTRESIESALSSYQGALLVASHDRYFIQQLQITHQLPL